MALAHEIAVDKDFTLQKIQPANAVEKKARHGSNQSPSSFHLNTIVILQVKEIMQKAFWDLLEQQLEADPPQYTQVRRIVRTHGVLPSSQLLWTFPK